MCSSQEASIHGSMNKYRQYAYASCTIALILWLFIINSSQLAVRKGQTSENTLVHKAL